MSKKKDQPATVGDNIKQVVNHYMITIESQMAERDEMNRKIQKTKKDMKNETKYYISVINDMLKERKLNPDTRAEINAQKAHLAQQMDMFTVPDPDAFTISTPEQDAESSI